MVKIKASSFPQTRHITPRISGLQVLLHALVWCHFFRCILAPDNIEITVGGAMKTIKSYPPIAQERAPIFAKIGQLDSTFKTALDNKTRLTGKVALYRSRKIPINT